MIRKRLLLLAVSLSIGTAAAAAIAVTRPGSGDAGDLSALPEVAPGVELIPVGANVSAVFDPAIGAPRLDPSATWGDSSSVEDNARAFNTPEPGVPSSWLPGDVDVAQGRLLLTGLGPSSRAIYAYPTAKGRLCAGLGGFSGGCLQGFFKDAPADWTVGDPDGRPGGEPVLVWGIIPDSVKDVRVVVNGHEQSAVVANNAYFFQAADNSLSPSAIEALTLVFVDGATQEITLETGGDGGIEDLVPAP